MPSPSPKPTGGFEWVQAPAGPGLICRPLARIAPHIFTTRGWALGSRSEAEAGAAWREVAEAISVEPAALVRVHQVHGAAAVVPRGDGVRAAPGANDATLPDADIIVSDNPSLALAIQTADCVPLLMADSRTGVVLAAHAGWRGTAARVAARALGAAAQALGSRPGDFVAAIGPSIGACCYEVGEDVRARFEQAGFSSGELARWFVTGPRPSPRNPSMAGLPPAPRTGHWFFDAWTATRDQLEAAGLPIDRIYAAELCTASHPGAFCSYRRDGAPAGRMAGVIRCPPRRPSPR
jgi:YfiH family protein